MSKDIKFLLIFLAFYFVVSTVLFSTMFQDGTYPSVDIVHNNFFSDIVSKDHKITYNNPYNATIGSNIFGPRAVYVNREGAEFPATHIGYIIIVGIFKMITPSFVFIVNSSLLCLGLFYLYKLSSILFDKKTAFISIFLFAFLAPVLFWSAMLINNIAGLSIFIVALYYFFHAYLLTKNKSFIFFSIFAGLSIWIRYDLALYYLPLLIPIIHLILREKIVFVKKNFLAFVALALTLLPLAIINFELFHRVRGPIGANLEEGINLLSPNIAEAIDSYKILGIFSFKIDAFFENTYVYLIKTDPLLFFFFVLALLILIYQFKRNSIKFNLSLLSFFLILLFNVFFYSGNIWSGYTKDIFNINSMYTRYLLPSYLVIVLISSSYISHFANTTKNSSMRNTIILLILMILFISNLLTAITSPQGIYNTTVSIKKDLKSIESLILSNTESNSVIFTKYYDKFIFPKRMTAIYPTFQSEKRVYLTMATVSKLLENNVPVYFLNEDSISQYDIYTLGKDYFPEFVKNNLKIIKINNLLYKIER
ncbi:MAG: hypothetical protein A2W22_03500 [Candidatus Levybacteria bacterium RBG_16_35_11]|nr:MAG: hypothetical protein A2W22_03500 [Candidatus Levybacteria bacterium RBG_16_35_11]